MKNKKKFHNELDPRLIGLTAYNNFCYNNASSRSVMSSSHLSQHLVLENGEECMLQTGIEKEMAKYNFSAKMPEDGIVVAVIERYPEGIGRDSLGYNPETVVIYEKESTNQLDYFTIKDHSCHDQYFGFKYKMTDNVNKLIPGTPIAKDTIFASTPATTENGGYAYGLNLNTAIMSVPGVAEDGFVISESAIKKANFKIYESRSIELGSSYFPLNIHGSVDNYKVFPEIGERLKESESSDGLLMALRKYDEVLTPAMMSIYDTMNVDHIFDKTIYVRGPRGKVVDIKVIASNSTIRNLPEEMAGQLRKYQKAYLSFYNRLLEMDSNMRRDRKSKYGEDDINLSPKLHHLLVEALVVTNEKHPFHKNPLNLLFKKIPIDEFRIEFIIEYDLIPNVGSKLTNPHGSKGVICQIRKDEDMPIDQAGNRAEVVMDPTSIVSRINIGVLYEHYISGASRDVCNIIRNTLKLSKGSANHELVDMNDSWRDAYNTLLTYYKIINDEQYEYYLTIPDSEKISVLVTVVNDMIYTYIPVNNNKMNKEIVKDLEHAFHPTYGKVTYIDDDNQLVTTVKDVRIAPMYYFLLDKIADDWAVCDSGKLQHFGIITPLTKTEKFMLPYKSNSPRTCGETESRIIASYSDPHLPAEIMDRSNNPQTTRNMFYNILNSDEPANIDEVVDRATIPYGNTKPMVLVRHIMSCAGFVPLYEPEEVSDDHTS